MASPRRKIKEKETKTLSAIKGACADIKKNVSQRTDRMADILTEGPKDNKVRNRQIKEELTAMVKGAGSDAKKNFEGVTSRGALRDVSWEFGRLARLTANLGRDVFQSVSR